MNIRVDDRSVNLGNATSKDGEIRWGGKICRENLLNFHKTFHNSTCSPQKPNIVTNSSKSFTPEYVCESPTQAFMAYDLGMTRQKSSWFQYSKQFQGGLDTKLLMNYLFTTGLGCWRDRPRRSPKKSSRKFVRRACARNSLKKKKILSSIYKNISISRVFNIIHNFYYKKAKLQAFKNVHACDRTI